MFVGILPDMPNKLSIQKLWLLSAKVMIEVTIASIADCEPRRRDSSERPFTRSCEPRSTEMILKSILRLIAGLEAPRRTGGSALSRARPTPPAPTARRLSADDQWARVSGVINGAVGQTESMRRLQASAEQQLDSATYALQGLIAELSGIMSYEAAGAGPFAVVKLEAPAARAFEGAIAA